MVSERLRGLFPFKAVDDKSAHGLVGRFGFLRAATAQAVFAIFDRDPCVGHAMSLECCCKRLRLF
jgi:hypothetical protein